MEAADEGLQAGEIFEIAIETAIGAGIETFVMCLPHFVATRIGPVVVVTELLSQGSLDMVLGEVAHGHPLAISAMQEISVAATMI